jgi:hypothetical protein
MYRYMASVYVYMAAIYRPLEPVYRYMDSVYRPQKVIYRYMKAVYQYMKPIYRYMASGGEPKRKKRSRSFYERDAAAASRFTGVGKEGTMKLNSEREVDRAFRGACVPYRIDFDANAHVRVLGKYFGGRAEYLFTTRRGKRMSVIQLVPQWMWKRAVDELRLKRVLAYMFYTDHARFVYLTHILNSIPGAVVDAEYSVAGNNKLFISILFEKSGEVSLKKGVFFLKHTPSIARVKGKSKGAEDTKSAPGTKVGGVRQGFGELSRAAHPPRIGAWHGRLLPGA